MTMEPWRYPDRPAPISARERAIPFGPMAETEIAAGPHPSQGAANLRLPGIPDRA